MRNADNLNDCKNKTCLMCKNIKDLEVSLGIKISFNNLGKISVIGNNAEQPIYCSTNCIKCLCFMTKSMNQLISREELEEHVWDGTHIGINSLPVLLHEVRKVLGYTEFTLLTIRNRGYVLRSTDASDIVNAS
ncbi:winged helix-turn-helix domain-containing protein [Vibrio sp. TRT 17S01]|uniref:winged helix-turn-helix domain-containing protein n=1 Tax=Vibrio sp. TRT 17S01 TaxID=3418505 RepID=UPI003CEA22D4